MSGFWREHAAPLVGSTALHVLVAAVALVAAWFSVAPTYTPPASIEAYVARRPGPTPVAPPAAVEPAPALAPAAEPAPAPAAEPEPKPKPEDPSVALKRRAEIQREEREAQIAAAEAAREREHKTQEARRKAEAAEAKKQAQADERRRKAEAEATARKAAATALEAKRHAAADAHQRDARESDLARQLAAEDHRQGAVANGQLDSYRAALRASIERAWKRPPSAKPGLRCEVHVTQVPGGVVTGASIGRCNGDAAVQQSITLAVFNASPLPIPSDPSLFERTLNLVFEPDA